ncbi:MAG: aldehyde ferredoxin oxidoreductase N-terminal domain-containing protein, partial [Anaerolineae bacterium]
MAKKNSYAGKILRVDLSTGAITTEELGSEYIDLFLGGRGIASKILYEEVPPEVEPFDPA